MTLMDYRFRFRRRYVLRSERSPATTFSTSLSEKRRFYVTPGTSVASSVHETSRLIDWKHFYQFWTGIVIEVALYRY